MTHGKKVLAFLLTMVLLSSMSICAFAEGDGEVVVEEPAPRMTVLCKDTDGTTLRDNAEDYLDLSKDQTVDASYPHPEIENYTYQKTTLGGEELQTLTVSHDEEGKPVINAVVGSAGSTKEKTLTGSETLVFVYEKKSEEHVHSFDEGKVTVEPTCTGVGEKTFTCSCGETKTEEIPALGHDWGEPTYTWAEDNSSCTASRTCKRDASHNESETVKPEEKVTKEATCTEKGEKSLTATFTDSAYAKQTKTAEIPALGHEYENGRCKRCDSIDPNFQPKLSDNTNGLANWGSEYLVISDAAFKDFQKVLIDGNALSASEYSVKKHRDNGSTVITITGEAIKKLKVGSHTLSVVSVTGTATKTINVSDKPKTGDESVGLWVGLLSLSALGTAAAVYTLRKKSGAR